MFSLGNHDKEHERLIRQLRFYPQPVTTLPTATASITGQRVTYNNLDYYCDGTRWLSTQKFVLTAAPRGTQPYAASAQTIDTVLPDYDVGGGIWIEKVQCFFYPVTVGQSGVNFYTLSSFYFNASTHTSTNFTLSGGTNDTKLMTTLGQGYAFQPGLTSQAVPANGFTVSFTMTPSGAPGTFYFWGTLSYRLIGA